MKFGASTLLLAALAGSAAGLRPFYTPESLKAACGLEPPLRQQLRGPVLGEICKLLGNASFLVFGTGFDSDFWLQVNKNGRTVFLENNKQWVPENATAVKNRTFLVKYTSNMQDALRQINNVSMLLDFFMKLPKSVKSVKWDVILVDGPVGSLHMKDTDGKPKKMPGRGQSIYAAHLLAGENATIFVDDCQREVEAAYVKRWLVGKSGQNISTFADGHNVYDGQTYAPGLTCRVVVR
mmetsp:Transcript_66910/g.207673  ORF Transcript_66910/g.207673 Transcript_66910/m.207673 type:complete len:237 (+) Transcript_66910:75-785(+)